MSIDSRQDDQIVEQVQKHYSEIASGVRSGCGCGGLDERSMSTGIGYRPEELADLPAEANLGLGCGAPLALLDLQPGETVVDLGSGGGIDVFLAAARVGPEGRAIGVDMTPEMVSRARAAAERNGYTNVEFRSGRLEKLPLEDASVDAATSNCVINLVPDKSAVFSELARVLRPGGRLVVSDIVLDRPLPPELVGELNAWAGCISGAERREDYFARLAEAGLEEVEVLKESDFAAALEKMAPQEVAELLEPLGLAPESLHGAVVSVTYRATKPAAKAAEEACCAPVCCGADADTGGRR